MPHKFDIRRIVQLLERQSLVSHVEIILVDEIAKRGFYKLRAFLIPSRFKLDIKFIRTEKELLCSYQLYEQHPIARWDNEPHYPSLGNYPHHFHFADKVERSRLSGNPSRDIETIFFSLQRILAEY